MATSEGWDPTFTPFRIVKRRPDFCPSFFNKAFVVWRPLSDQGKTYTNGVEYLVNNIRDDLKTANFVEWWNDRFESGLYDTFRKVDRAWKEYGYKRLLLPNIHDTNPAASASEGIAEKVAPNLEQEAKFYVDNVLLRILNAEGVKIFGSKSLVPLEEFVKMKGRPFDATLDAPSILFARNASGSLDQMTTDNGELNNAEKFVLLVEENPAGKVFVQEKLTTFRNHFASYLLSIGKAESPAATAKKISLDDLLNEISLLFGVPGPLSGDLQFMMSPEVVAPQGSIEIAQSAINRLSALVSEADGYRTSFTRFQLPNNPESSPVSSYPNSQPPSSEN
jgi:hypothetical protein